MTPHLHPRSRLTTSLFGTTLLVSFLVVGMPHLMPCPAPRVRFADSESEVEVMEDGRRRRRRRQTRADTTSEEEGMIGSGARRDVAGRMTEEEKTVMRKRAHECPVPKPRGLIGEVLGFKSRNGEDGPPLPRVETVKAEKKRDS